MAIIKSLALSRGGGVICPTQQADQAVNTVSILIGLGGTGIDCIREIKTQVYSRIKPDDGANAVIPEYSHIRFLGVDSDYTNLTIDEGEDIPDKELQLDEKEIFLLNISESDIAAVEKAYPEYRWVSDKIVDNLRIRGSNIGKRQMGRFLLMANSKSFMKKLENIISEAAANLRAPNVEIHIFSGLGGATGSGTFLDVCYMVRDLLIKEHYQPYIYGYFFTPDVNAAHVYSPDIKKYILVNGYAALQELDYCMNISNNNGAFEQVYQGGKIIKWDDSPVNLCHLISAVNATGAVHENAYEYAIKVTGEYVLGFLTKHEGFSMMSKIVCLVTRFPDRDNGKKFGYNLRYVTIGASCARIPAKEINTYLASKMFEIFKENNNDFPCEKDVNDFAVAVLGALDTDEDVTKRIYNSLYSVLQGNAKEQYEQWGGDV